MKSKEVLLGEIFDIERGGSPRPIQNFLTDDADGIPWIMIGDTEQGGKYINSTKSKIKRAGIRKSREVYPGELLLSNSMSFGRPYILRTYGCIHDGWLVLRPKTKEMDTNYAYHGLGSQKVMAQFQKKAAGATVKNLNKAIVASTIIPLPPLEEQRRIAAILDSASSLIFATEKALRLSQELKVSLVDELLSHQPRGSVSSGGTRAKVSDVADIITGFPFKSATYSDCSSHIRLCRGINVLPGRIEWIKVARWPEIAAELQSYQIEENDILIAMDRPWIAEGFKIARVLAMDTPSLLVQRVARIRASKKIRPRILYEALSSKAFAAHCSPTETTIPHISPTEIREYEFTLPPIDEQIRIDSILAKIETIQAAMNRKIDLLKEKISALSSVYFC